MGDEKGSLNVRISLGLAVALLTLTAALGSALVAARFSIPADVSDALDRRLPYLGLADIRSGKVSQSRASSSFRLARVPASDSTGDRPERYFVSHIEFNPPFTDLPKIILSVNTIDEDHQADLRYHVFPVHLDERGADIDVETWDDTKINFISVDWLAYQTQKGAVGSE